MRGLKARLEQGGHLKSVTYYFLDMCSHCLEAKVILHSKWVGF